MSFGIMNAHAIFYRFDEHGLQVVLRHICRCLYDILVYSISEEDHEDHLRIVCRPS